MAESEMVNAVLTTTSGKQYQVVVEPDKVFELEHFTDRALHVYTFKDAVEKWHKLFIKGDNIENIEVIV